MTESLVHPLRVNVKHAAYTLKCTKSKQLNFTNQQDLPNMDGTLPILKLKVTDTICIYKANSCFTLSTPYPILHYLTRSFTTLPGPALPYPVLHYLTRSCTTLPDPSLPYPVLHSQMMCIVVRQAHQTTNHQPTIWNLPLIFLLEERAK